jgi:7-cyano-7-deazaguanine reductase
VFGLWGVSQNREIIGKFPQGRFIFLTRGYCFPSGLGFPRTSGLELFCIYCAPFGINYLQTGTVQYSYMAQEPRYTDDHAKAGLDFAFPAIETWQNQFPGYEIVIDDPELTSVCPKTGLPDFGALSIRYMPSGRCLELKSLKEYLFCYRNLGIFQENIVNQVLEDVVKACDPVWAVVRGEFRPRGGIATTVEARWPRPAA